MGKFIGLIIFTVLCCAFALIPETAMYFLWHMIQPESEVAKVMILGIFWFGGAGLCVFFGFLGFLIWGSGLQALF